MTPIEIRKKWNTEIQIKWFLIFCLLSLIPGAILFALLLWVAKCSFGWSLGISLLGVLGLAIKLHIGGIALGNLVVPDGSKGVLYYQGSPTGKVLDPMNIPVVVAVAIPFLGEQEMVDVEVVSIKPQKRQHALKGITTKAVEEMVNGKKKKIADGIGIGVPMHYNFFVHKPEIYAANVRSNATSDGDTTSEGIFEGNLDTIGKRVSDHFTYDEIDDSLKINYPPGGAGAVPMIFAEAIEYEIKENHGGIHCRCVQHNGKDCMAIDELGITIISILPTSTLATNAEYLKKRERAAVEMVDRTGELMHAETEQIMISNLRQGIDSNGKDLFPNGAKNPFKNMSDGDIIEHMERVTGVRKQPEEFILTSRGNRGSNLGAMAIAAIKEVQKAVQKSGNKKP